MRSALALLVLPLLAGRADAVALKKPAAGTGFQTKVGAYSIAPGADIEMCEYRRLTNKKAMDVQRFKLRMPPGAHHFALWTYGGTIQDDSKFPATPIESVGCVGMGPDAPFPQLLIPTTTPNSEYRFPRGVALHLEPEEQVFLNPHMKNFGTTDVTPDVRFNFYKAKKGTVKHHAEGLSFGNSTDISIPPGGDQTMVVDWVLPVTLTIVHLTTHQHSRGTYASIQLAREDGSGHDLLVETHDWEHPTNFWPSSVLRLEKGRTLRLTCSWHNKDTHTVTFGPETTDEMCFGIGFVYRDDGDTTPLQGSGCIPSKKGVLCPIVPSVSH